MKEDLSFAEIEYKWVVAGDFDDANLRRQLQTLIIENHYKVNVQDTYFIVDHNLTKIYRHRFDERSQQLTVKSRGGNDISQRLEVNLLLDRTVGDQLNAVRAFLGASGQNLWEGVIHKQVEVFYLPEIELVIYQAKNHKGKTCHCVEIEARKPQSLEQALSTLDRHAQILGLNVMQREKKSLFDLLLKDQMSQVAG